jgi:sigma-B regulation protein RsbU (phosphoserine phosphatase)
MNNEKILLVDDNPTNLQVLFQTLEGRGYNLLVAKNGETALAIVNKAGPNLVLLDIMMPGMDGHEVCRRLKADPATREIPVIFLSALGDTKDKVQGLDLGAVDYITKPFQPDEVIARVNTHLTIYRLKKEVQAQRDELENELQMVAQEQRRLLPESLPQIGGLKLSVYYETSRYAGGDYYDVIELPDNRWGFMMADAAGHSTQAAVLMAMTCTLLRSYPGPPVEPDQVLENINHHLCKLSGNTFMTAIYIVYDANTHTLRIARAGHPPPILYRPEDGQSIELPCKGVYPLAIEPYAGVPVTETKLQPGDRLMLYTDGITERFNRANECYDVPRLLEQFSAASLNDPRAILDSVMASVDQFADGLPAEDDQAILVMIVE